MVRGVAWHCAAVREKRASDSERVGKGTTTTHAHTRAPWPGRTPLNGSLGSSSDSVHEGTRRAAQASRSACIGCRFVHATLVVAKGKGLTMLGGIQSKSE